MSELSSLTLPCGIIRTAIFDDWHENVQAQINDLCIDYGLQKDEIKFEKIQRYIASNGDKCTYAVIKYWKKEPKKEIPAE